VSYVQVPEDEPAVVDVHRGLLIAPLELADGELIGVLSTEGPVDIGHLAPGVCELVELYAEQVRLALRHSRVQGQLVAQLQEARELRELDEYRRDLLASITHDLKTPITAITLNTELLEADRRFADAGASPVAAIRRSTERLGDLVDDLLALARAEEGRGGRTASEVDLVEVVEQACAHSELLADERGVTFALDSPDALVVAVDGDALGRAFVNVVGNAVKYSLPDGQVRLRLRRLDDHVELTCADDGIGISEEDLPWIFEMFRRSGDAEARDIPGSGFGLAISQRIVTRLGGSIEVDSAPDQGSTFVIRVPVG
jgi:signal transduction histidine kinase